MKLTVFSSAWTEGIEGYEKVELGSAFSNHAIELAGDQGKLVAQSQGGFAVMKESQCDIAREAKGNEAAISVECEGFGVRDTNEGASVRRLLATSAA